MCHPLRYLSRGDVQRVAPTLSEMVDALDAMFQRKGRGETQMPPKMGVCPTQDGFLHAMPAYIEGEPLVGLKWIAAYPENRHRGLDPLSGVIVLNAADTGLPLAIMDAGWITGMRTAAATGVAARHLARPEARRLGVIGCGLQGRTNLLALSAMFDLEEVHAYDHRPSNSAAYVAEMTEKVGVSITPVATPEEAVRGMDLVVSAAPIRREPAPVIPAGWLEPGAFACALDYDASWSPAAMAAVDLLVTDDRKQWITTRDGGHFSGVSSPPVDLGEISAGLCPGRVSASQTVLSLNLGLALDDVVVAAQVYSRACELDVGVLLDR